jgi:MFS family permease
VGNVLSAFSHNIILFSLSNLIQGMGGSFAFIAAAVLISQWFSVKQFPILFGLTQTLSCIISGILHSVMANQLLRHSWNTLYLFLAACGAVIFVLTICFVKSPPNRQTIENLPLKTVLTGLSRNNQLILCVLAAAMSFGALLAYASFWYMTVQKYYAVSPAQTYTIGALIFAGIGIGTPIFGAISNYFQSRTMVIHVSLTLGTMMLLAGMYLPHFDTHSLIIIKITSFLIGFLLSGSMLFYTIVSEIAEDSVRGVALSVTNTGVFLFNAAMLFIPTFLITKLSTEFFTTLWIIPCCLLVSILVLYFIKDSYRVSS